VSEHLLSPAVAQTLARLLRTGATVKTAAGAVEVSVASVWGWVRRGERERRFASITRAFEQGRERNRREELDLARQAARLLMGGATVKAAANELGVSFSHLRGLVIRARGSDGRAPDRALAPLAATFPTQSRKGRMAKPRCKHCGAVLAASTGRRAAA
jgi:transposase-like protein